MKCQDCPRFQPEDVPHPTMEYFIKDEDGHCCVESQVRMVYDGLCTEHEGGYVCSDTDCRCHAGGDDVA